MHQSRLVVALAVLVLALIIAIWMMDFANHSAMAEQYYMQIWIPTGLSLMIGALAMHIQMSKPLMGKSHTDSELASPKRTDRTADKIAETTAEGEPHTLLSTIEKNKPEDILI